MDFGGLLERFWVDFEAKLEASWGQVGTKIGENGVPRRCQKNAQNLEPQGYAPRRSPGPLEYYNTASQKVYRDSTGHQDTPLRASGARWRIYY